MARTKDCLSWRAADWRETIDKHQGSSEDAEEKPGLEKELTGDTTRQQPQMGVAQTTDSYLHRQLPIGLWEGPWEVEIMGLGCKSDLSQAPGSSSF